MKELQSEVQKASNRIITACNLKYSEIVAGADKKQVLNGFKRELYAVGKDAAPMLQATNVCAIYQKLYNRYFAGKNSWMWMMQTGKGNPPMSFGKKMPIPIADMRKGCDIGIDEFGRYTMKFPFLSTQFKEKWNKEHPDNPIKYGKLKCLVDSKTGSVTSVLERCMTGEYSMCGSDVVETDKGVYVHLVYQFDAPKPVDLDPKRVCGIDLGVKYAAVCAISDMPERKLFINGASVIQHCIKLENKRRKAQRLAKYDTHDGHGRKPKTSLSKSIRNKQSNFRKTTNRKYAKDIVDFALKNGCGEIRMEDLSGFSGQHKGDKFLGKWTYYQLQDFISQKADSYGISVVKVKPKDTSRRCSICGHIDADNRLSQEEFKCQKCGFKANADFNAARNIAQWAEKIK